MAKEPDAPSRTDPDSDRLREVHGRAMKRLDTIWSAQTDGRAESLDDRRFYSLRGAQWEDQAWGTQFENAPRLEINKTHKEVIRLISDYRNQRIEVDFRPKDVDGSDELADTLDGLYRADAEACGAQEAHDLAFEEGVGGGMGAWRLRACYEDEADPDNEQQRIVQEAIPDADQCVLFDLNAKRQDKSDAKHAFILTKMSREAFEEEHEGRWPADLKQLPPSTFGWFADDGVYVAEYYEIEEKRTLKVSLTRVPTTDEPKVLFDPDAEMLAELEAEGWTVTTRRRVKKPRVHKYVISGQEVLSDEGLIAGAHIPIVPFYGKRWFVEGIERWAGHVRYAKDPQRVYNAEVSKLAEVSAASPFERPIFDPEQVAGLEGQWADANIERLPYSLARALRNVDGSVAHLGAIGKVEPPSVPQALAALIQISSADIAELTGAADQQEEVPSNVSAQAIELVHTRADAKTFIYLDNFRQAMRRCGQIWLSMACELYVENGRKMQAVDPQGGRKYVTLGEPVIEQSGAQSAIDLTRAKMDVTVDVGPSSVTRRDATVRSLVSMSSATSDPELQNVLTSTALMNMDGEGIDDVQKWIRMRLVRQGVVQPTEEEAASLAQEAQNQQPDPNAMLAQGMTEQALAEAEKAKAGTIKTLADAEKVRAQIMEILAGMERADRQQFIDAIEKDADRLMGALPALNGAGVPVEPPLQ